VVSVVGRFALVAAAVSMAVDAAILPWSTADTDVALIACMERWLGQRGNTDAAGEPLQEIRRRRQAFAATIDDRLIRLCRNRRRLVPASVVDQGKVDAASAAVFDGYIKDGRILLTPAAWHRLWTGLDGSAVKDYLLRAQLLICGAGGDVPSLEKFKTGARPDRFYVLAPEFVSASA
jgi:hypothetical protein